MRVLRLSRFAVLALAAMALTLLSGCQSRDRLPIANWKLYTSELPYGAPVHLPAHLTDRVSGQGDAYRLVATVALPPTLQHQRLTLFIPFATALLSLKVNGTPVDPVEPPPRRAYRALGTYEWVLPEAVTREASLTLELSARNEWFQSTWLDTVPRLVPTAVGDPWVDVVRLSNFYGGAFALIAFLQLCFTYLAVFVSSRRRLVYLWFGISAFFACGYPLFELGYTQYFLGRYDVAFLAFMMSACCVGSVYFTHALFQLPRPSRLWPLSLLTVLVLIALFPDVTAASVFVIPVAALVILVAVAHQLLLCTRLARTPNPPRGVYIVLVCWLIVAVPNAHEISFWLGLGEHLGGIRAPCLSLALYALLQSLLLSREHLFSLERSDDLNIQLASRVRLLETQAVQVKQLNDELRRQVQSRSRQLAEALAGAATGSMRLPAVGDLLQDRYRVMREIGSGGMGSVFEVVRETDGRRLALKVTSGSGAYSLARLAREAQVAAEVSHPNVVSIVDVEVAVDGVLYLIMEYVDGPSLDRLRDRRGDVKWAVPILEQLAQGLAALHARGVIHRDLKPANILLAESEGRFTVKITDFGISRLNDGGTGDGFGARRLIPLSPPKVRMTTFAPPPPRSAAQETAVALMDPTADLAPPVRIPSDGGSVTSPRLTQVGQLVGTPPYIPPEAVGNAGMVGAEADIFAFGVIGYELLTRARPFQVPPASSILEGKVPLPAKLIPNTGPDGVSPELAALLLRCVSFDPAVRPTAAALVDWFASNAAPRSTSPEIR